MAWTATENFDSYTPGTTIAGLSGGSGWTANWVQTDGEAADATVETAPVGGQGGVALRMRNTTSATDDIARRSLTAISAGSVRVRARVSNANASSLDYGFILGTTASGSTMFIRFGNGNIQIFDNSALYVTIQAFSVDTWYTIDVEFDDAAQPDSYRARVNEGTWSAWKIVSGGAYTTVDRITIINGVSASPEADLWIDGIEPTPAAGPAPETRTITMVRGG